MLRPAQGEPIAMLQSGSSAAAPAQRIVDGLHDHSDVDLTANRQPAARARHGFGGAQSDVHQRDEIVDRHCVHAATIAGTDGDLLRRWTARYSGCSTCSPRRCS